MDLGPDALTDSDASANQCSFCVHISTFFFPDSYKAHCNLNLEQLKHNHFIFESTTDKQLKKFPQAVLR